MCVRSEVVSGWWGGKEVIERRGKGMKEFCFLSGWLPQCVWLHGGDIRCT